MKYVAVINKNTKACIGIVRDEEAANRAIEKRRKYHPAEENDEFELVHGDAPCPAFTDRD